MVESTINQNVAVLLFDELTYEMWQEEPVEMKDALYRVVNQVIQNGKMPPSWEGGTHHTHPKEL